MGTMLCFACVPCPVLAGEFWVMNSTSLKVSSHEFWPCPLEQERRPESPSDIPSQSSLLQMKHLQIFLLFLKGLGPQSFHHLGSPFMDWLQFITVFLKLWGAELNGIVQVRLDQSWVEQDTSLEVPQIDFLCSFVECTWNNLWSLFIGSLYKTELTHLKITIKPYFGTGLGIVCKKLQKWEDYSSKIMVSIWRLGT